MYYLNSLLLYGVKILSGSLLVPIFSLHGYFFSPFFRRLFIYSVFQDSEERIKMTIEALIDFQLLN